MRVVGFTSGSVTILLSPMGGQGFLIGRGNLQLSPDVLRKASPSSVLGVCTPSADVHQISQNRDRR